MTSAISVSFVLIVALIIALLRLQFSRELEKARQALVQSQERLNLTLRSSQIAVWSWELASDKITADDNSSVLFGLPLGQFPQTLEGFAALLHPDDRPRVQQEITASIQTGADYNTEFRVVWPQGTIRYLSVRGKVYKDESGTPERMTGLSWDITKRRQAEDDLRAANDKLTLYLKELERRKEEGVVLSEMADLLQACSSSTQAYEIVARFCEHLFPDYSGALYIFSASRNLVHKVATWSDPVVSEAAFEPHDCWALLRGHPHIIEPGHFATTCRHLKDTPRDGQACLPLMAQGTGLGIVYLQNRQSCGAHGPRKFLYGEERELAVRLAERAALSLANLSLQETLRVQSIRDPLTGLFNRRYLEESGERELHRMERREQPSGLLMMDLDHFKVFNDTFGHDGGDALLRAFGQFLRDHLRKEDIGCRYGGEEFCVLLPEASHADAVQRAEQLRSELKRLSVQHHGRHLGAVTISIGVASYPSDGTTIGDLIAAADSALYMAKEGGRDCVISAGDVPAAEILAPT
jgi:diguanylate cyclase (GGDEF)-like protein/PAS domain S-box-containing protein